MLIKKDYETARLSSMGIGGVCDRYCEIEDEKQWGQVWKLINGGAFHVLGHGSNTVFGDVFHGTIVKLKGEFTDIRAMGTGYICGGGASLRKVCKMAKTEGLSGLEGVSGIPASVGGGVFCNCGAFGQEIADAIEWVEVAMKSGVMRVSKSMCGFSYRKSGLFKNSVVTRVKLRLEKSTREEVEKKEKEFQKIRKESQPIGEKSCGSAYVRGEDFIPAKMIDEAGLKGYRVGGVAVSKKHAGFLVNIGGGSPRDFLQISRDIESAIFEKYGVKLKREIKFIGEIQD